MNDDEKVKLELVLPMMLAFKSTAYYKATGNYSGFEKFFSNNQTKLKKALSDNRRLITILRSFRNSSLNHLPKENSSLFALFNNKPRKISTSLLVGDIVDKIGCPILFDNAPLSYDVDVEQGVNRYTKTTFLYLTQKNWFDVFKIMASKSYLIFIIPDDSLGVRQEMEFIVQNKLLSKLIVLMTPTVSKKLRYFETLPEGDWNFIKNRLSKFGFNLPDYNENGAMYIPKNDLSPQHIYYFEKSLTLKEIQKNIENAFEFLTQFVPEENSKTSAILNEIKDYLIIS